MKAQNLPQQSVSTFTIKIVNLLGRIYLLVPDQAKMRHVLVKDIVRLEGVRNYTILHLKNGDTMISSRTLKVYENILLEADFLRVHKAHLINMQCLRNYDESDLMFAVMQNRDKISISRRKRKDFQVRILDKAIN
ncbi:MAG: LytTR family DNA-binding domain-containing protein [Bacteroidota bacterium]|jgi:two-component system LytT family response regulator